jgi:CubicO group peptidase (beta-lactamase class C family)
MRFSVVVFSWLLIGLSLPAAEPKIAPALQPFVESHSLAGAVTAVANKDKVLSLETVGFMDVGGKKPMQADSLFWIASMSKPITGTGLMLLVDEGKVSLDDPVEKYLPEFKELKVGVTEDGKQVLKAPSRAITVRDVMSHTSGMPFSSAVEKPTLDGLPLKDAVRSYATTPLLHEPGTKYQYSNAGINTGARIIEVVSGMKYEDFMDERLFKPLGMKDTTFWPNDEQVTRLAKAYKPTADKMNLEETTISQLIYPLTRRDNRYPMPAGGLFSTATDVATFCRMLLNGGELNGKRYISAAAIKTMSSKQTGDAVKDGYGIGWSTGGTTYGHGGALSTNMTIDTQRGLITVFLVQHAGFPNDGNKSQGAFVKAAQDAFGK